MDDNNLKQELESLKNELQEFKKNRFSFKKLFKSASFVNGFIFALIIIPLITYAFTVTYTFTSGTSISASEVNQNFQDIEDKLNAEEGFLAEMSGNQTVTCVTGGSSFVSLSFNNALRNDSNYNTGTSTYSVPASGYYYFLFSSTVVSGSKNSFRLIIEGSPHPTYIYNNLRVNELIKLTAGDDLSIEMACDDKKGNVNMDVDATKSYFGIIPI